LILQFWTSRRAFTSALRGWFCAHPADAIWLVQATTPSDVMMTARLDFFEIVNIGFLLCVSGVLIHPTRATMPMRRLSVVKRSIHEPDMSMA
jgi:hypothetical protein